MGAVYIVHSREDAGRFVEPLSKALERAGLDPVAEPWALGVDDSLIDRIFLRGLKDSELVLVVLSRFNTQANWARFELEESVTDRIQAVTKLGLVLLDGCREPEGFPGEVSVFRINEPGSVIELSSLIQELGPLLRGKPVAATRSPSPRKARDSGERTILSGIPEITEVEATVLALSCRCAIESNSFLVKTEDVSKLAAPLELDGETFQRCLDVIATAGHIRPKRANGGHISTFEIERAAFGHYMQEVLEDTDEVIADLASEILAGVRDNETLVERFELPHLLVTYILDDLDSKGHITVIRQMKGNRRIKRVSPEFRQLYSGGA